MAGLVSRQTLGTVSAGVFGLTEVWRKPCVRALLRHNFLFDEPRIVSIDRLRRELDLIARRYCPLSVPELETQIGGSSLRDRGLVFTTDDVHLDVYEVYKEFQQFNVPLSMYIPVGWVSSPDGTEAGFLTEAVTLVQWYEGEDQRIAVGESDEIFLSDDLRHSNVDRLLSPASGLQPYLEEICEKIGALPGSHRSRKSTRSTCTWMEVRELSAAGVHIGAHSISHVRLSEASEIRKRFEIFESKRILEQKLGSCTTFAYPYGTPDSYDDETQVRLKEAGFSLSFLTHSDVITRESQPYCLPRIFIPDRPLELDDFEARIKGAGILPQKFKEVFRRT